MAREDTKASAAGRQSGQALSLADAASTAKQWLAAMLKQEDITNIGLEEISHQGGHWSVTLGFSRPWDTAQNAISVLSGEATLRRTYKVLTIDERTGTVVSMRNRD